MFNVKDGFLHHEPENERRVALGQSFHATPDFQIKSWVCHYAYATFCRDEHCRGSTFYSGQIAYNDDVEDLNIKSIYVESAPTSWAETFWTIYENDDCTGKSAILPIRPGRPFIDWKDYLQTQLGFRRH